MSGAFRRWSELRTREALGEALSVDERQELATLGAAEPLAQRELALLGELEARVDSGPPPARLIDAALAGRDSRSHLRVVPPGAQAPVAPSRPRRAWWAWAAAGGALGLAAAAVVWWRAPAVTPPDAAPAVAAPEAPARAELVLASGQVHLNERVATVGEHPLERGQRLSTAAGRACFTIDPGIDVCLGEHSAVALESLAPSSVRVRVASGTVLATLSKRPPGSTFALLAADVTALARGTVFAVKHAAPVVEVSVLEGVVDVARAGRDTKDRVAAHGRVRWTADAAAPTLSAVGRGEEARLWSLGAARELWSERELGVLHVARAEGFVSAAVEDEAALPLPLSAFVPAGRRRITLGTASGADVTESVEIVAGERREIVPALPASSPAPSAKVEAPDPDALLAAARRELARGDARAALALYQRFRAISPGSAEAATVRVTMGKLELDLGRPARALGHFDAYLAGGGPLAPEALAGKIRALQRLGRTAEERRAIDRYLRAYPDGFEAPVLQRRRRALDAP